MNNNNKAKSFSDRIKKREQNKKLSTKEIVFSYSTDILFLKKEKIKREDIYNYLIEQDIKILKYKKNTILFYIDLLTKKKDKSKEKEDLQNIPKMVENKDEIKNNVEIKDKSYNNDDENDNIRFKKITDNFIDSGISYSKK